jgi:hypothetical protein
MFHPFQEDLSHLKDAEVESKLQELNKKYFLASRMGNRELLTQISSFVTIYKQELAMRNQKNMNTASAGLDRDLDQLINVDK